MPLSVAVLADPSLTLHEPLGFYEKLNPALADAVRDALAADFAKVAVVDDRQSADGADLLALPATDIAAQASQDKAIESLSIHPAPTIVTPTMVK